MPQAPSAQRELSELAEHIARHRGGMRAAKEVLDAHFAEGARHAADAPQPGAPPPGALLPPEELLAFSRCLQFQVPMAAAPASALTATLAAAAVTAAARAPALAFLAQSRASLAASAGLLHFQWAIQPSNTLAELCYVHTMAGPGRTPAQMRQAYRRAGGSEAFAAAADGIARSAEGGGAGGDGDGARAGGAGGAGGAGAGYRRVDFADRVEALMQFIPGTGVARGEAGRWPQSAPRPPAQLRRERPPPAPETPDDDRFSFARDEPEPEPEPGAPARALAPAAAAAAAASSRRAVPRSSAPPKWDLDFGYDDEPAPDEGPRGRAAPAPARAPTGDETSFDARRRRREELWDAGSTRER